MAHCTYFTKAYLDVGLNAGTDRAMSIVESWSIATRRHRLSSVLRRARSSYVTKWYHVRDRMMPCTWQNDVLHVTEPRRSRDGSLHAHARIVSVSSWTWGDFCAVVATVRVARKLLVSSKPLPNVTAMSCGVHWWIPVCGLNWFSRVWWNEWIFLPCRVWRAGFLDVMYFSQHVNGTISRHSHTNETFLIHLLTCVGTLWMKT